MYEVITYRVVNLTLLYKSDKGVKIELFLSHYTTRLNCKIIDCTMKVAQFGLTDQIKFSVTKGPTKIITLFG